jgi:hypothetical protein
MSERAMPSPPSTFRSSDAFSLERISRFTGRGVDFALFLAVIYILVGYAHYALNAPPSFDGAMNLNAAWSFAQGHGYGFLYGQFFPFPAQTDGPFTLPSALLMRVGGIRPITTQGVNLGYLIGAVVVAFLLVRRITRSTTFGLLGAIALLTTPGVNQFSLGGFGEMPCLFWFLTSQLVLSSALDGASPSAPRLVGGGLAIALCFLTKTVALLLVAPTVGIFFIVAILGHRHEIRSIGWFLGGLIAPIIGWEIFRLIEIGGFAGYHEWWHLQFGQTLLQSGAAPTPDADHHLSTKIWKHLGILSDLVGEPIPFLIIYVSTPLLIMLIATTKMWNKRDLGNAFCSATLVAAAIFYFIWWLAIERTDMAWPRRIFDGLAIQQMVLVLSLAILLKAVRADGKSIAPRRLVFLLGLFAVSAISGSYLIANGHTLTAWPEVTEVDRGTIEMAEKVRDLPPDATLFGFGWWKAPVLALFSQRVITDFYSWNPEEIDALPHKYLIVDFFAKALDQPEIKEILAAAQSQIVADGPGGTIYELTKVLPYPDFTPDDRNAQTLLPRLVVADGPYAFTRGFYPPGKQEVWLEPQAAVLLKRTQQNMLSLTANMPPNLIPDNASEHLRLDISSAGCLDSHIPIEPGIKTFDLPLSCAPEMQAVPMEISFSINGHIERIRQIDADRRRFGYTLMDLHLQ